MRVPWLVRGLAGESFENESFENESLEKRS